ncbi:MAG: DNA-3-methyladenine glycosylase 2 family protein [Verrucomicrobia bacterium]|nr:DNA-3-methyladenine glycosylase 2 family protein [Verrucomicrobiota bacterium]
MSFPPAQIECGLRHLRAADPIMSELIERVGPFRLRVQRNRFQSLVRSIIAQQISGHAARSIHRRLQRHLAPRRVTPENLARLTPVQMRSAGLSPQKAAYLRDLSQKILDGQVQLTKLARRPDEEVITELVRVKGIGLWTAQMFLIFCLGRLNVFPHQDLGVRAALRNLYGLAELPDRETSHEIAQPWRPFATLGSWYCWRSLELREKPTEPKPSSRR